MSAIVEFVMATTIAGLASAWEVEMMVVFAVPGSVRVSACGEGDTGQVDKDELGLALRRARDRVQPSDVGLPAGPRRRVAGLRRHEVATLAGVSVEYVTRLEQGRGPRPSASVLTALSRALRLDDQARDHLFRLAGVALPTPSRITSVVSPRLQGLIDRLSDLPVLVLDAKSDVIAWNDMATALLGDMSVWPTRQRNIVWQRFLGAGGRVAMEPDELLATEIQSVASLRAASARYPDDLDLRRLIADLREHSPRFVELWDEGVTSQWRATTKTVDHPELGRLVLDCDMMIVPDADQVVIVYSAAPNTQASEALQLLRVIGSQQISVRPT